MRQSRVVTHPMNPFADAEGSSCQGFAFRGSPGANQELCQIVESIGEPAVFRSMNSFLACKRGAHQRFGLLVHGAVREPLRQIALILRYVGMICAVRFFV